MISDQYTDTTYGDDYLAQLRENMGQQSEASCAHCAICGHRFAYRVWPAAGPPALGAFIGGLVELEAKTGMPAYGLWVDDPDRGPFREDAPTELWRAADFALIATGTFREMALKAIEHPCLSAN